MQDVGTQPPGASLSWDSVHRLEVLLRTRSLAMSHRRHGDSSCAACGAPIGDDGMRVAGVVVHPGCLPGATGA